MRRLKIGDDVDDQIKEGSELGHLVRRFKLPGNIYGMERRWKHVRYLIFLIFHSIDSTLAMALTNGFNVFAILDNCAIFKQIFQ